MLNRRLYEERYKEKVPQILFDVGNMPHKFRDADTSAIPDECVYKSCIKDWQKNIKKYADKGNWLFLWGTFGTGKCLVGDTYIKTSDGMRKLSSLFKGITLKEDEFYPKNVPLSIAGKKEYVTQLYFAGSRPTVKLTTDLGISLEGSFEEPLLVWDAHKFEPVWKHMQDITEGDCLIIDTAPCDFKDEEDNFPVFKTLSNKVHDKKKEGKTNKDIAEELNVPVHKVQRRASGTHRCSDVTFPDKLDKDLSYFFGLLYGDGCITRDFRFCCAEKDMEDRFSKIMKDKFNVGISSCKQSDRSASDIRPSRGTGIFRRWLDFLGILGQDSSTKKVPDFILEAGYSNQLAFVQGIMDTDGHVSDRSCEVTLNSENLIDFIQNICLSLGIISCKKRRNDKCVRLYIRKSEMVRKLFTLPRKRGMAENYIYTKETQGHKNAVPGSRNFALNKLSKEVFTREHRAQCNVISNLLANGDFQVSTYNRLRNFLELKGIEFPRIENMYFNRVTSKSHGSGVLYDVTNPTSHRFVANGHFVHNTASANILLREVLLHDGSAFMMTQRELLDFRINGATDSFGSFTLEQVASQANLVLLDDIGNTKPNDFTLESIEWLATERYNSGRSMIYTSNLDPGGKKIKDYLSGKVLSMCKELATTVQVSEFDWRTPK